MHPAFTKENLLRKIAAGPGNCWIFTGALTKGGYGRVSAQAHGCKTRLAHRAAYLFCIGSIPKGQCVLHRCDVRRCVNPKHLFLGSRKDNMDDRLSKGRGPMPLNRGPLNGSAKLTEQDILSIRSAHGSNRAVAFKFGISAGHVSRIRNKRKWAHL